VVQPQPAGLFRSPVKSWLVEGFSLLGGVPASGSLTTGCELPPLLLPLPPLELDPPLEPLPASSELPLLDPPLLPLPPLEPELLPDPLLEPDELLPPLLEPELELPPLLLPLLEPPPLLLPPVVWRSAVPFGVPQPVGPS
jgi:hypothetical protein